MAFYSDSQANGFQPKRQFRFLVNFSKFSNLTLMATKVGKPSYEMEGIQEHRVLNHTFKYPGIIKWQDISAEFIDSFDPDVGSKFWNSLLNAGYVEPVGPEALVTGITKFSSAASLGTVTIKQLDGGSMAPGPQESPDLTEGFAQSTLVREEWVLHNAFIKGVKWGELDYGTDDIVKIGVDLTYDWATYIPGVQSIQPLAM